MLPQTNVSSESQPSDHIPEGSSHATPPPPSRESSMASLRDVAAPPGRPAHLPPRPASPPRGYQFRLGDTNKPDHRFNARSTVTHDSRSDKVSAEAPARPSPAPRRRNMDTYPSESPPAPRDNRAAHSPERPRTNLRDSEAVHHVARNRKSSRRAQLPESASTGRSTASL